MELLDLICLNLVYHYTSLVINIYRCKSYFAGIQDGIVLDISKEKVIGGNINYGQPGFVQSRVKVRKVKFVTSGKAHIYPLFSIMKA